MHFKNILNFGIYFFLCTLEILYSISCVYYYGIRCMGCDMKGISDEKYYKLLCDHYYFILFNFGELYDFIKPHEQMKRLKEATHRFKLISK